MIVDDEFDIVRIFKQALKKKGFHVFGFTESVVSSKHFQINVKRGLVISDPRMPAVNGYKFRRSQRDQNRNEKYPSIRRFAAIYISTVIRNHLH